LIGSGFDAFPHPFKEKEAKAVMSIKMSDTFFILAILLLVCYILLIIYYSIMEENTKDKLIR
jgi:hypothetical protein